MSVEEIPLTSDRRSLGLDLLTTHRSAGRKGMLAGAVAGGVGHARRSSPGSYAPASMPSRPAVSAEGNQSLGSSWLRAKFRCRPSFLAGEIISMAVLVVVERASRVRSIRHGVLGPRYFALSPNRMSSGPCTSTSRSAVSESLSYLRVR